MGRGAPLETLAEGITRYATRFRVTAAVGRRQREKSFKLGTPLEEMLAWQHDRKSELLKQRADEPTVDPGTLAADVTTFLATVASTTTRQFHLTNLLPWVALYGQRPRTTITSVMIRQALATWQVEPRIVVDTKTQLRRELPPYAANTLNHRLSSLRRLYAVLDADDEHALNPCARVRKLETPDPEPREIPRAALDAIFDAMPVHRYQHGLPAEDVAAVYQAATTPGANKSAIARAYGISETAVRKIIDRKGASEKGTFAASRIRLQVKRTTGLPWKQVGAIRADHLRAGVADAPIGGHVWVTPRRKGKGTKGRWLPVTHEAMHWIQQLVAHCPGAFSPSSVYMFFHRTIAAAIKAAAAAGRTLPAMPPNVRPYDIRHTFLTQVLRASRNRKAVQELGLHAQASTSDRYTRGAEMDGQEAALAALPPARTGSG